MLLIKVVLLIWYSEKNIVFGKIDLIFGPENLLWTLKMPNFWWLCLKPSYKISKNPLNMLIGGEKSIEFHLSHYEIPRP